MLRALAEWSLVVVGAFACGPSPVTASKAPAAPAVSVTSVSAAPSAKPAAPAPEPPERLEALVHLPSQLAAGQKAPLLLLLHSIGTSAADIEARTDWPKFAEVAGIAWIAPNGPKDALGRRFWDAGKSCCNFGGTRLGHVAALRELLERTLRDSPSLDAARVFVGGISNGGFMAHRFACEAPELIRGMVSISGAGPIERVACQTPTSLRVLEVHGEKDPIVRYGGGHFLDLPLLPEHLSAKKTLSDWATRLGCAGEPIAGEPIDLEKRYPGAETQVLRYQQCERGALELWTVRGGDHYLAFHEPAPHAIWQFLDRGAIAP
jgi:polyhydroxybutyrate depolymerase